MSLSTIHLHGHLKEKFGGPFKFAIRTPAEAVRALGANFREFYPVLKEGNYAFLRGSDIADADCLTQDELTFGFSQADIHIMPEVSGAKNSKGMIVAIIGIIVITVATWGAGTAPAIAGAAAAEGATAVGAAGVAEGAAGSFVASAGFGAAGAGLAPAAGGGLLAGFGAEAVGLGGLSITFGQVAMFGASLVLQGVSSLLASTPKGADAATPGGTGQADNQSYMLSGPMNAAGQGGAVPLLYGRCRAGATVVYGSLSIADISTPPPPPSPPAPVPDPTDYISQDPNWWANNTSGNTGA